MNANTAHRRASENRSCRSRVVVRAFWLVLAATGATGALAQSSRGAGPRSDAPVMAAVQRCDQCHRMDPALSHPVGVAARAGTASHLPLEGGRITCVTCHEPTAHNGRVGNPMLRSSRGSAGMSAGFDSAAGLCVQCHEPSSGTRADAHATGMGRAHLASGRGRVRSAMGSSRRLDDESVSCLGCHDGAISGDVGVHEVGLSDRLGGARDHPIGVVYSASAGRTRDVRLHEPARLDPRVRLFDSMVGCGSCHSVYARQNGLLVMSNLQSRLCLSCHAE